MAAVKILGLGERQEQMLPESAYELAEDDVYDPALDPDEADD